jgi:protein SCO1/2
MTSGIRAALTIAVAVLSTPAPRQVHAGHVNHERGSASGAALAASRVMKPQPVLREVGLVDQDGRATTLRSEVGGEGPVLVNFIFTSCTTICPVMSTAFAQFLAGLEPAERDRVRLVSISIDPDTDTADVLRAYAARYHAGPSWRFLTGTQAAVEAAQRAFATYRGDRSNHNPATYLRRSAKSPWEEIEGLSSAEALRRAYGGRAVSQF